MSKRRPRFRIGDEAVVVDARVVERVGYPRTVASYESEVDLEKVSMLLRAHGIYAGGVRKKIVKELAYGLAKKDGFGGRKRSIHFESVPGLEGQLVEIRKLRVVMTGTYSPATFPSYGGGYDFDGEPACLLDLKPVQLAEVAVVYGLRSADYGWFEIPVAHLASQRERALSEIGKAEQSISELGELLEERRLG